MTTSKPVPEIKCKKIRQCGWNGLWSELKYVNDPAQSKQRGYPVERQGCPRCGNDEFYAARTRNGDSGA